VSIGVGSSFWCVTPGGLGLQLPSFFLVASSNVTNIYAPDLFWILGDEDTGVGRSPDGKVIGESFAF
jgi:hypothetical protein